MVIYSVGVGSYVDEMGRSSEEKHWLGTVGPGAARRVFGRAGTGPAQCASALLAWAQRADLALLRGQALDDALADVAMIVAAGGASPSTAVLRTRPNVSARQLADLAAELVGTMNQLKGPGAGPKESGQVMAPDTRHLLLWDPISGGPARSLFVSPDFLTSSLLQLRELIGQHIHRIARCQRCPRFFLIGKRAQKFCSPRCANAARTARFTQKLAPEELKRRHRRAYLGRLLRRDPVIATRYLARIERTDPAAARWLKRKAITDQARRRSTAAAKKTKNRTTHSGRIS